MGGESEGRGGGETVIDGKVGVGDVITTICGVDTVGKGAWTAGGIDRARLARATASSSELVG